MGSGALTKWSYPMNSYLVTMHTVSLAIYRVEANSEDEAVEAIHNGEVDPIKEDCLDSDVVQIELEEKP
jgi:hypothetical protein